MRIDKFALWAPAVSRQALPSPTDRIVDALNAVARSVGPDAQVPGLSAYSLCVPLGGARDALCDASTPSAKATNTQLDKAVKEARVVKALAWFDTHRPDLKPKYEAQFRHLTGPGQLADDERRARLAELIAVEIRLMREVAGDLPI